MIETNYANAYKEVLVILDHLIKEDYNKIPKNYIEFLKSNCNNEYEFYYDNSKTFEEQELLDDTKYILFGLFEKFGATKSQKDTIKAFKNNYYNKLENEKREKYNPDCVFKTVNNEKTTNNSLIKNKETFFIKFKNFIFKILHIKNK